VAELRLVRESDIFCFCVWWPCVYPHLGAWKGVGDNIIELEFDHPTLLQVSNCHFIQFTADTHHPEHAHVLDAVLVSAAIAVQECEEQPSAVSAAAGRHPRNSRPQQDSQQRSSQLYGSQAEEVRRIREGSQ
jgi:hypothetical protein